MQPTGKQSEEGKEKDGQRERGAAHFVEGLCEVWPTTTSEM